MQEPKYKSIIIRKKDIRSLSAEMTSVDTLSGETQEVPCRYLIDADFVHFRADDAVLGVSLPERVIFNDPATIVFWEDGTKTVVKADRSDWYSKKMGFLLAFFQKYSGLSRRQANLAIEEMIKEKE